jgi:hypothetical protein
LFKIIILRNPILFMKLNLLFKSTENILTVGFLLFFFSVAGQNTKPKSYIISKQDYYTIDIKSNKPSVVLFSEEQKWIGDKDNNTTLGNRIDYTDSFEEVSNIEAYSISPQNKKETVRSIHTEDRQIDEVFYHDMKFKYYYFPNLKDGSETYSSYKKLFRVPQLLDTYYFKDNLDCKDSQVTLKVSNKVEMGYVLRGDDIDKILFTSRKDGEYTIYNWQLLNTEKVEAFDEAPNASYYLPHLIFYIKNYTNDKGKQEVLGSVDNLYQYYYQTVNGINKTDQTALKSQTLDLIKGLASEAEKAKAIFDFVQTKVHYVAFEDGMGGFIPREAADVFQKKYGDCKDMANLLNEMLHYAGIESYIAWIGTRHNNYTYEEIPTPIVDNHMIAVARINDKYVFLDATGQFTIYPGFTPFIQGKQALLKIDEKNYKIVPVPVIGAEENNINGKIAFHFDENKLVGDALLKLKGFSKTKFVGSIKNSINTEKNLKEYLARFIENINTANIEIKNDDLTPTPLEIKHTFDLEKWVKKVDNQIILKPILFFPLSNYRIDVEKRKVPMEFDFEKSYNFEYDITIPEGYSVEYKPDNYEFSNALLNAKITYTQKGNKLLVNQEMKVNTLLIEKKGFADWNTAIKSITKQYNQNIILSK